MYEELDSAGDLPAGWTDVQEGGSYRLERRDDDAVFGHNVGPESWKRLLFPPTLSSGGPRPPPTAEWRYARRPPSGRAGVPIVRSCDLHAIAVQDRTSSRARGRTWITSPAARAPSSSPSTAARPPRPASASPWAPGRARAGFDLALTELLDEGAPFPGRGGEREGEGAARRNPVARRPCRRRGGRRARSCARRLPDGSHRHHRHQDLLYRNREHPRWDEVADRCLTCGNCTMVCRPASAAASTM